MSSFCPDILLPKNFKAKMSQKVRKVLSYKKGKRKMLMTLTPMVNYINILAFWHKLRPLACQIYYVSAVKFCAVCLIFYALCQVWAKPKRVANL